jgi:hypothetical protein
VRVHDFLIKELGRAVPYGIYDLVADHGWVSVGMDHDTAAFAVQTIRRWWQDVGRFRYPQAKKLMIGMTAVACFAARVGGVADVTMTSTLSRTNSAAFSA